MTNINHNYHAPLALPASLLAVAFLAAVLSACSVGPMEPGRRALDARRVSWAELTSKAMVSDSIYDLTDAGDILPLTVRALPLTDPVLQRMRELWGGDRRLMDKADEWLKAGRLVILVGIYTRDVTEDDLIKDRRFRLSLRADGSLKRTADKPELLKGSFLKDYFPIFNPWERVVVVSFPGQWNKNPVLILDWPGGSRELDLVQPTTAAGEQL
ncbi:MAG: hypothetical protein LBJ64_10375 [Deltaproteobacteria bacterium]|nr:hypothetical protein [Deltaproteobacteria bacterium]